MYVPQHFSETDLAVLQDLITQHPLGALVTYGHGGLDANHLPFEFVPLEGTPGTLRAHVARQNPVWQDVSDGDEVLVIFRAAEAYVSPNWYPSKHEFHKQVPTWNYMVVHAHGRIRIRDDERYVRGVVGRLTRAHEASQPKPWKMGDSAPKFIDTMLKAIVGIEIEVDRLVGKFKLSQNREHRDMHNAGTALKERGDDLLGGAMLSRAAAREG